MQHHAQIQLRLANDRIADAIRVATDERHAQPRPSLRRTVGHSIIRIGERLAAEPTLRPAQPFRG